MSTYSTAQRQYQPQAFDTPPQAYSAPPPSNQQLQPYQPAALTPYTAPPPNVRGESYGSQHSHRSRRSHHSNNGESRHRNRRDRKRETRPSWGDTIQLIWNAFLGAFDRRH